MFYTIYQTTNLINGRSYIGMHKTKDLNDGYIGSGILLRRAIKKYGIDNFSTVILHVFNEEWKMKVAERILVVPDKETSYNLCPGGKGGWGYINKESLNNTGNRPSLKGRIFGKNPKISEVMKKQYASGTRKKAIQVRKIFLTKQEIFDILQHDFKNNKAAMAKHYGVSSTTIAKKLK